MPSKSIIRQSSSSWRAESIAKGGWLDQLDQINIYRDDGLGPIGKGISVKPASRDASGCIIEHTKSARPPNHIDSHPVARAIPFT